MTTSRFLKLVLFTLFLTISRSAVAQTQTVGLFLNEPDSYQGYTLFVSGATAYMIDNYGRLVHQWDFPFTPGGAVYLLENGQLLWFAVPTTMGNLGAHILKSDWDGNIVWQWQDTDTSYLQHHDIEPLPNGNVLVLARDFKTISETVEAGRDTSGHTYETLWSEMVFEIQPIGSDSGVVVWEWRAWDHLVQEFDSTKENYDVVADHPELMDINFTNGSADWLHSNGMGYSTVLDQIIISHRTTSEIWVIDHSTTTADAAGHSGGNNNMGGDLIYRWGNPVVYQGGDSSDQTLYFQHNSQWIAPGLPGAGNLLVFNNGNGRGYSSVDQIVTPVDGSGNYPLPSPGMSHGPLTAEWSYVADPPGSFFAGFISGAQRLPNGNTLICEGPSGDFFEVDSSGQLVWRYINPVTTAGAVSQGETPSGNNAFRCTRYGADFPGLEGRNLAPGGTLEIYPITISQTSHFPVIPSTLDSTITITTVVDAPDGITIVELFIDTGSGYFSIEMFDDGAHNDADDGIFGATPATHSDSTIIVNYYVSVEDHLSEIVTDPPNPPVTTYRVLFGIICGNVDGLSGTNPTNILDLQYLVNYIFRGGPEPPSLDAANVDGITGPTGTKVDLLDLNYLVNYIFRGGPAPVCE